MKRVPSGQRSQYRARPRWGWVVLVALSGCAEGPQDATTPDAYFFDAEVWGSTTEAARAVITDPPPDARLAQAFRVSVQVLGDPGADLVLHLLRGSDLVYEAPLPWPDQLSSRWTSDLIYIDGLPDGAYSLRVQTSDLEVLAEAPVVLARPEPSVRPSITPKTSLLPSPPPNPSARPTAQAASKAEVRRIPEVGDVTRVEMGCSPTQDCPRHAQPFQEVVLPAYAIDAHEVTTAAYLACVEAGSCTQPHPGRRCTHNDPLANSDHPVNCVDWFQADAYCRWVGKRLPSAAEWERAAKGPHPHQPHPATHVTSLSPSSMTCEPDNPLAHQANCDVSVCLDPFEWTAPVGRFPSGASPEHIHDLAGNVTEWVDDWLQQDLAPVETYKILRGSHFDMTNDIFETWFIFFNDPTKGSDIYGFRCAQSLSGERPE